MKTNPGNSNVKVTRLHRKAVSKTKKNALFKLSRRSGTASCSTPLQGDSIGSDFTALHLRVSSFFLFFRRRKLESLKSTEHEMQSQIELPGCFKALMEWTCNHSPSSVC